MKNLVKGLWSLVLCLFTGCATTNDPVEGAHQYLAKVLPQRDTQTMDLEVVGRDLVKQFGQSAAFVGLISYWREVSKDASTNKIIDVVWLQDQTPRVRDAAWLLNFHERWLTNY